MKTSRKIFWTLFLMSVASAILVLPYALTLENSVLEQVSIPLSLIVLISIVQSSIIFAIATYFGLVLSQKIGFRLPLITAWLDRKKIDYLPTAKLSVIAGVVVGLAIVLLERYVFPLAVENPSSIPSPWLGLLASPYGGIAEEVLMRLFLMSLFVFVMYRLFLGKKDPNAIIVWIAIIAVSVLFGLGHLPATATMVPLTSFVIARAIVLNGIGGVVFGWLYWKKGLESAIIAHFCADLMIHFLLPLIGFGLL